MKSQPSNWLHSSWMTRNENKSRSRRHLHYKSIKVNCIQLIRNCKRERIAIALQHNKYSNRRPSLHATLRTQGKVSNYTFYWENGKCWLHRLFFFSLHSINYLKKVKKVLPVMLTLVWKGKGAISVRLLLRCDLRPCEWDVLFPWLLERLDRPLFSDFTESCSSMMRMKIRLGGCAWSWVTKVE